MDASPVGSQTSTAGGGIIGQSELCAVFIAIEAGTGVGGGIVSGEAAGGLAGASGLIHEGADDDIARAIPYKGLTEVVVLPARGVQGVCRGAIDLLQRVGVDITGVCGEGTEIGLSDEDGEFLGIAAVGSESEIYSGNAACSSLAFFMLPSTMA